MDTTLTGDELGLAANYTFNAAPREAVANWQFENLEDGSYELLVTWLAGENRASDATFDVFDGSTLLDTIVLDQQLQPDAEAFGGKPWQSLGAFEVVNGQLTVELTDSANGSVVADAVRLVRLGDTPLVDNLEVIRLAGNPLNNHAFENLQPLLGSVAVVLSANNPNAPVLSEASPFYVPQNTPFVAPISSLTDADGDEIFFSAESDSPFVFAEVVGGSLVFTPAPDFVGTTRITLVARDRAGGGRTAQERFDVHVGTGGIHGVKWHDLNQDGIVDVGEPTLEGRTIFIDDNTNGQLDAGEQFTLTDANGNYAFNNLEPGSYPVTEIPQPGWVQTTPETLLAADFSGGLPQGFTSTGDADQWSLSTRRGADGGHSPSTSFYFGDEITGQYLDNAAGTLTSPVIDLTGESATDNLRLDFNYFLDAGSTIFGLDDTIRIAVLVGQTRTFLTTFLPNTGGSFSSRQFDLSSFAGEQIRLEFEYIAGSVFGYIPGEGWYVDDIVVSTNPADRVAVNILSGEQTIPVADNYTIGNLGNTTDFETVVLDVSAFIGGPIQVEFEFAANDAGVAEGWYVDDVAVFAGPRSRTVTVGTDAAGLVTGIDLGNFRVVDAGPDQTVNEGTLVSLNALVNDPDLANGSNFSFLWQVNADNGQIVPSGSTSSFDFTPDDNGTYVATLTVTDLDNGGLQYVDTVTIVSVNVAPIVDLGGDRVVDEGDDIVFVNPVTDAAGDTHTFAWELVFPDGSTLLIGTDPTLVISTIDDEVNTVRVTVTDDDGAQATSEVLTTVRNVVPQNVDAGFSQTVDEGTPVSLTASFTDPGTQDTHTFTWNVVASNGQSIGSGTDPTFDFIPIDNGFYTVLLAVIDGDGGTGFEVIIITVDNVAPQNVDAGPDLVADEGDTVDLAVSFNDPGTTDTHTILWEVNRNATLYATGSGTDFSFVPTDEGTYTATVTVTDSDGEVDSDQVQVTANNLAPTADAGSPYSVDEGSALVVTGTASDPGSDDLLAFSWDINGDGTFGDATGPSPTLTWAELNALGISDGPSMFNVLVRVDDGDGGVTTSAVAVLTV
ncbi:MAG: PKD domain-containing protein, partial [Pirellulales bacterium]